MTVHAAIISVLSASLLMSAAAAAAPSVDVWVRTPGTYGSGTDPAGTRLVTLELDRLPQQQVQRMDAQYGSSFYYRGVPLQKLVAQYKPPQQLDLLLLHFRNGMSVPLPFRDVRVMARLNPLVALETATSAEGPFSGRFPPVSKHIEEYVDVPQVMFTGNKIVVSESWHPDLPEAAQASFTPWMTTDTLVGIEFADSRAYYRQFESSPEARPGLTVYRQNCQYCHGVRKVGASFGGDFAQPIALYKHRQDPYRLFYHIHYRIDSRPTLEQMPVLKHVSEEDAQQLWRFMRAMSTADPTPYAPAP